jgi:ATP-dependent DNA helicase PIF1
VKDAVVCKEKSITQKEITDNLSIQQREIVEACCKSNSNVFFTGCAGTGKSYLTSIIIQKLCKLYGNKYVYVTATTGLAACAIDGVTIHQFAGISALREQSYSNNINSIINQV